MGNRETACGSARVGPLLTSAPNTSSTSSSRADHPLHGPVSGTGQLWVPTPLSDL